MRRILSVAPMILCISYTLFPLCRICGAVCGYNFILCNYPLSIVALTVISATALVLLLTLKIPLNKAQAVFSVLLPPLSALNGLFFVLDSRWELTIFFILICYGCSIVILIKFSHHIVLKVISTVFSVLLVFFLLFSSFIQLIFGDLGLKTIVKSVVSPEKTYVAEVIDSDQGALGGNTHVDVWNKGKVIELYICKFSKSPVCVYTGDWGEFNDMQIAWKDEHTLVINSKEYCIND